MVLPRALRAEIVTTPDELMVRRTADGLLLTPVEANGSLGVGGDGPPLLTLDRAVGNLEVLDGIDRERTNR